MPDPSFRFLIVAGEASGDLHGSNLVHSLKHIFPASRFRGMGGKKMRGEGVHTFFGIERMGAVGAIEILGELPHYLRVYRRLSSEIASGGYDAAILIDYPTLNLRLAEKCRKAGCPVFYFISPQIWAWRGGRIKKISRTVDRMFVILPFEEDLYREAGVDVEFLGHPFADMVHPALERDQARGELFGLAADQKVVGLLPGSRKNEIEHLLEVMVDAAGKIRNELAGCRFVLPVADSIDPNNIRTRLGDNPLEIQVVTGRTYDVMNCCDFLIVASGSATLEAGILGCPMVIVYRLNPLTHWLAQRIVNAENIGLVNIVAGERVVPELVQKAATAENVARECLAILNQPEREKAVRSRLLKVRQSLGNPGVMRRIAQSIAQYLNDRTGHEKVSS